MMHAENLERQLEELEVLQAIYPDKLTIDATSVERIKSKQRELADSEEEDDNSTLRVSFTIQLMELAKLNANNNSKDPQMEWCHPSITIEFPPEYPSKAPPKITKTTDEHTVTELVNTAMEMCIQDHSGEECTMQLIMSLDEQIEALNERLQQEHQQWQQQKQQEERKNENSKTDTKENQNDATTSTNTNTSISPETVIILGRRIINSPYILKPAKIRDLKKCADELQLGGYAKVGKPGIIVIEGPEEGCQQYCPMLEDRGWKYQKVQGQQQQQQQVDEICNPCQSVTITMDKLRRLPREFRVLGGDSSVAELGQLCREAGLADLFFESLNIHNSVVEEQEHNHVNDNNKGKRGRKKK